MRVSLRINLIENCTCANSRGISGNTEWQGKVGLHERRALRDGILQQLAGACTFRCPLFGEAVLETDGVERRADGRHPWHELADVVDEPEETLQLLGRGRCASVRRGEQEWESAHPTFRFLVTTREWWCCL